MRRPSRWSAVDSSRWVQGTCSIHFVLFPFPWRAVSCHRRSTSLTIFEEKAAYTREYHPRERQAKTMPILNEKPRPRALFIGFEPDEVESLKKFFPTTKTIRDLDEVRQAEWDILLTKVGVIEPAPHMYILSFGADKIGNLMQTQAPAENLALAAVYDEQNSSMATEFVIPEDLDSGIVRALERDVLPKTKDRTPHSCLGTARLYYFGGQLFVSKFSDAHNQNSKGLRFQLFLGTPEPRSLVGSFIREGGKSQVWMLPYSDLDIAAWVELALKQWHKIDPEKFPVDLGWERSLNWMTPVEAELALKIEGVRKSRQEMLARLNAQERELMEQLHAASIAVDSNERLLLTAQGEVLVQAVAKAFEELGFHVQDMDKIFPPKDRREDLRIRLAKEGDWVAICEVKGYYKGAQVNDLLKIERFRGRFFKETGRDPDRCWYVANHHAKDNPSTRGSPLPMNAEEVATFSEGGGLVISTFKIFQLLMDVRRGNLTSQAARELLMSSTGLLSLGQGKQSA